MSDELDPFAGLIGELYEAAAEPARWSLVWTALLAAFDAGSGLIYRQSQGADGASRAVAEWPPAPLRSLDDGRIHLDPFAPPGELNRCFSGLLGREVPVARAFGPAGGYPDFARARIGGATHVLEAALPLEGFTCAGIALHRAEDAGAFSPAEARALDALARHIAAALRLERRLAETRVARATRDSALDQLGHGAIIATGAGQVLFANRVAQALAQSGAIQLDGPAGLCPASDPAHAFASLLRDAAAGKPGGILRLLRPNGPPLSAAIVPLPTPIASQGAGLALITLRDVAPAPEISPSQLMALFDLTPAEASIVPQLLAGASARVIAQSRGVKAATVRDQAARILTKTGAPNLRALATMIAQLGRT